MHWMTQENWFLERTMKKNIWVFFVNLFMYSVVKQVWDPLCYVVCQVLVIIRFYSESWEHKRRRHTFKQVWKKSKYCQCDNKSLAKSWLGWGPLGLRRSSPGRWTWGFGVAPAPAEEAGPEESAHPGLQALVGLLPQQHLQAGGESSERSESPPGPRPRSTSSPVESAVELGP